MREKQESKMGRTLVSKEGWSDSRKSVHLSDEQESIERKGQSKIQRVYAGK